MSELWFVTTCNKPRLADPAAVLTILGRYRFDWDFAVEVKANGAGHYRLQVEGEGWPGAWLRTADDRDDEPDFPSDGLAEFEALLSEIAPHLAEPLIVQAIGQDQGRF